MDFSCDTFVHIIGIFGLHTQLSLSSIELDHKETP